MTDPILIARKDALVDITLNTPANGNLVSNEMGAAIIAALAALPAETKLVRLLAAGPDFCRGRVSPMPPKGARVTAAQIKAVVADPPLRLYDSFRRAPVPVLCAVKGQALGVGCALAAACDLTIADADALFQVPEMEHDIPPLLVMTALIHRTPVKAVGHLVLSCARIGARQAREWGLVTEIAAAGTFDQTLAAMTQRLLGYSLPALHAIKDYLRAAKEMTQDGATALAGNLAGTALSTRFGD